MRSHVDFPATVACSLEQPRCAAVVVEVARLRLELAGPGESDDPAADVGKRQTLCRPRLVTSRKSAGTGVSRR
jgi:hypothetical protein